VHFRRSAPPRYPQEIKFELLRDKIELLDAYDVNQPVRVFFNIRGNEWQGRHFVNLQAWRLQALGGAAQYRSCVGTIKVLTAIPRRASRRCRTVRLVRC